MDNEMSSMEELNGILNSGPSTIERGIEKEIPPIPVLNEQVIVPPQDPTVSKAAAASSKEQVPVEKIEEIRRSTFILPSKEVKEQLKAKFGELRVVPIPFTENKDGKVSVYILRKMNRSNWRALIDQAKKVAESKPGVSADELFREKVISFAVVWPNLPEHEIAATPAGLVDSLFGVVERMGLFVNPDEILEYSYML